jgi:hypothetical protein
MSYAIWLIFFFLVAMVAGVIGILRYQRSRKKAIADKAAFLKENGKKINVDFADCDVVHREYYEEDKKTGDKIKKNISIVTFQTDVNGKKILFKTPPIFLAGNDLKETLAIQRNTSIYYESSDPQIYYFDVEFLLPYIMMTSGNSLLS